MWSVGAYFVVFVIPVSLTGVSIVLYIAEKHKKREKKSGGGGTINETFHFITINCIPSVYGRYWIFLFKEAEQP